MKDWNNYFGFVSYYLKKKKDSISVLHRKSDFGISILVTTILGVFRQSCFFCAAILNEEKEQRTWLNMLEIGVFDL